MYTVQLHYTEPLVRRAILAFWCRNTGWMFFLVYVFLVGGVGVALYAGERSWWVGVVGATLGIVGLLAAASYFIHLRGSLARYRRMKDPTAILEFDEQKFRVASDVGVSEMNWSVITDIWCYPEFWLVFYSRSQFMTLPMAGFDERNREFFLAQVSSAKVIRLN